MRAALAAALIVVAVSAAAAIPESAPADGTMSFAILRDGSRIGTHRIDFRRNGADLKVETNIDIAVKVLRITAYRFRSTRVETWRGGALIAYQAATDEDGSASGVQGRATPAGLVLDGTKGSFTLPAAAMPNTPWNRAAVSGRLLFDPDDGTPMQVAVADKGASPPPAGGPPARHYHLTGDTDTELWFAANRLVGVRLKGRDGSLIDYHPD
jgi:hypothetical protein